MTTSEIIEIVILGGALAGPTAARAARSTNPDVRITLLERAARVAYPIGAVPYLLAGDPGAEAPAGRDLGADGIEVRTGIAVDAIDAEHRVVRTAEGDVSYDALVFALGAESIAPRLDDLAGATNVYALRTPADWDRIRPVLRAGVRVAVLGGGFFGVEAADALARRGCRPIIIERGDRILSAYTARASKTAADALRNTGVEIRTGVTPEGAERSGDRVTAIRLSDGETCAIDLVAAAIGVRPRTELLAQAGAELNADGSARIDEHCRTTLPGVFACGVCAGVRVMGAADQTFVAQAAVADKTAYVAGVCAAGGDAVFTNAMSSAVIRAGETTLGRSGLGSGHSVRVDGNCCDAFMNERAGVSVELFFDDESGRVLGGEVVGTQGVDKRVDVLAAACAANMTVRELATLDLSYAPTFSTPCDVINAAAQSAVSAMARSHA